MKEFLKKWVIPPGFMDLLFRRPVKERRIIKKEHLSDEEEKLLAENKLLKDRHTGERCFILGAGPSINKQDLTRLTGEYVISVSNTFVHPDYHIFTPKYHVLPPLLAYHGQLNPPEKWIPWLREMDQKTPGTEMFFHIGDKSLIRDNNIFSNKVIHWCDFYKWDESPILKIDLAHLPSIWSVSEFALMIALYLGFENIYLLGIDHDWFNGPLRYFYDPNTQHKMKPDAERISFADAEFQMRRHAIIFKKYKYLYALKENIYNANANPDHYLDVFPKVDYESLFI